MKTAILLLGFLMIPQILVFPILYHILAALISFAVFAYSEFREKYGNV